MAFTVIFFRTGSGREPVRDWLRELPKAHRVQVGGILWMLQTKGPEFGLPHSRSLGAGLHELRVQCEGVSYRLFYGFVGGRLILLVHGISKKSRKAPAKELLLARTRLKEYLEKEETA